MVLQGCWSKVIIDGLYLTQAGCLYWFWPVDQIDQAG